MNLSIIIISYNTKKLLIDCLQSIEESEKSKNRKLGMEVIIVDNHSTDGTRECLKEIKDNQFKNFTIKTIFNQENVGWAKANNQGIRESGGEYLLFLNPDTIVLPFALTKLYHSMEKDPQVGIATGRINLANGQFQKECHRGFPTPWNSFCHFTGMDRIFPKSRLFAGYFLGYLPLDVDHEIDACTGAFMMVKRKVGEKIGWWDEDYFWYGEDLDICYRTKKAGFKTMYYPYLCIIHYHGASSGIIKETKSKANAKTKKMAALASTKAMRTFYQKHYQKKYPTIINKLTISGINLLEKIRVKKIASQH